MLQEFKDFIMRGNVLDMAVGIVIGAAFGTIVNSFVTDILMPPVGLLLGGVDFSNMFMVLKEGSTAAPYASIQAAQDAGAVTWNYGLFANSIISFLIIATAIFMVVKAVNKMQKAVDDAPEEEAEPPVQEQLLSEIRDLLKKS